jgi:hypothetical protein
VPDTEPPLLSVAVGELLSDWLRLSVEDALRLLLDVGVDDGDGVGVFELVGVGVGVPL